MTQVDQQQSETKKVPCPHCNGTGWMVRDPDIGTDQECFVCGGTREVDASWVDD